MKKVLMLLTLGLVMASAATNVSATSPEIRVQNPQAASTASVSWWSYLLSLL